MRFLGLAACCLAIASTGASAGAVGGRIAGHGFAVVVPRGWHGRIVVLGRPSPVAVNVGNFPLPNRLDLYGNTAPVRWPTHGILVTVVDWTAGATSAFRRRFRRASPPLRVSGADDLGGFEGVPSNHALLGRNVQIRGRLLQVWVQIGSRPATRRDVRRANAALALIRLAGR